MGSKEEINKELIKLRIENDALRIQLKDFISKYPRRVWTCKKRNTTSVEMCDGSVVIVRRKKGEKDCIHTAICYAIVKNMIGSEKLNQLAKNAAHYEPKDPR